ncbi:MAG: hypothetical protein PHP83_03010 [Clostridia bacterium]|nr:hypothetical protein [Clostridia bacterium]
MKNFIFIIFLCLPSISLFGQTRILTKQSDTQTIDYNGTITANNQTVPKQIQFSYTFHTYNDGDGRGKIVNMTNDLIKVKVTCINCENVKNKTQIIEVKPRTFSRIEFQRLDSNRQITFGEIKCEL